MNCSVCFLVILLGAFALSSAEESPITGTIQVIDDVNNFLRDNPGVTLTKLDSLRSARAIHYSLGYRRNGDRLVGTSSDYASWASPQDVQLVLNYPNGGVGAIVTYVSILVDQTSNLGNGYVLSGGIGQRSISILIEARSTYSFSYVAEIYGL